MGQISQSSPLQFTTYFCTRIIFLSIFPSLVKLGLIADSANCALGKHQVCKKVSSKLHLHISLASHLFILGASWPIKSL